MGNQRFRKPVKKGGRRVGRDASHGGGTEVLYGRQPIREMLLAGRRRVDTFYVSPQVQQRGDLMEVLDLAAKKGIRVQPKDISALDSLAEGGNHQGVVAVVSSFRYVSYKKMLSDAEQINNPLFLFLDHLEDPQNVGSLLRTAEAAGVCGVVIPEHRAAGITATVVRASAGASEHMAVAQVPNLVRCMRLLQERGVWFAGLEAGEGSQELTAVDMQGPMGIVVGSEGKGMRRLTRESCDYLVRLPMLGKVTSLNAAVAGAIALYEVIRQRREQTDANT